MSCLRRSTRIWPDKVFYEIFTTWSVILNLKTIKASSWRLFKGTLVLLKVLLAHSFPALPPVLAFMADLFRLE
jgi:hypothetical protein